MFELNWNTRDGQLLRTVHTLMDVDELNRMFGVDNSSSVVDDYEVIYIRRHRKFHEQDELQDGPRKRSSDDNHAHYSFATKGK